ncbi:hypothetical protein [Cernens ardua]|uniref:hypothetical protein n=1 Tax=Cernens ardua TaxID=3402176 RepID=UPI003F974C63
MTAMTLAGCAASPPETGPDAVCANVFSLGKWLVAQRPQSSPWSQQKLLSQLKNVRGSQALRQMVNGAYDVTLDDDDPVSWRQLQTTTFAQQWQSQCLKSRGEGFQPQVWPALWRKSFIDNKVTMPFY